MGGTAKADVIKARGGNDRIKGRGGKDRLSGGPGRIANGGSGGIGSREDAATTA